MELREHNGKMYIRDFCFEDIAKKYGTPFYLYDLDTIKEKIHNVKRAFGGAIELYYAAKANPNLEILKAIRDDVDGLDISSAGELKQSLLAGYDAKQLSFAGPGKTPRELQEAIRHGIGIISVESMRELQDIRDIASAEGTKVNITFRINPQLMIKEFAIKMGGKPTQFGIDEEDVPAAIDFLKKNETHFNFLGIHIYAGTQCMKEEAIVRNVSNTLKIALDLHENYGLESRIINLGGGFGVSYYEENQEIDLDDLADQIKPELHQYTTSTGSEPRFILELGRYLVAEAGIYVAQVVSEKKSRGEHFFVLDGGMNHHLAASGNLGSMIRKNYVAKNLSRSPAPKQTCNLVGPLCTPLDLMGQSITIESPQVTHLIGILNSGSYAFTASPLLFLGHTTPVELLITPAGLKIIRKKLVLRELN